MKFNLELLKASIPFCVKTEGRMLGEVTEFADALSNLEVKIYEHITKEGLEQTYFGVDSERDFILYDEPEYFDQEGHDSESVTLLSWEDVVDENSIPAWDGKGIPPVGTVCQADIFVNSEIKSELITGEIVKVRHNGTREIAAIMNLETFKVVWSCKFYPLPVEEVSWQDEVEGQFGVEYSKTNGSFYFRDRTVSEETFLEMCRVTLKAKGEIE